MVITNNTTGIFKAKERVFTNKKRVVQNKEQVLFVTYIDFK